MQQKAMTKLLIFVSALLICIPSVMAAESFGIVATVNKDAISQSDLEDRLKLVLASSGLQNTKANRQQMAGIALDTLIEETIKKQEAQRQNLPVTPDDVTKGFEAIAAQNNMDPDQFSQVLKQQGIPKRTLLSQIEAQIAWTKVIQSVLRPRVDVSESDVNAKMDRLQDNIGGVEYEAYEIFLPVDTPEQEEEVLQLAQRLVKEIKFDGIAFETIARQFSKSQSAETGGAMGWVQEGQLSKELDLVMRNLAEGQVSSPIKVPAGYHIIKVTKKRTSSGETLPTEDDVLNSIGLERLDRLQQRYLADLKSSAFIDRRI
jgi:peptidyl-prolyl cis-trans isomerase SurA